MVNHKRRNWRRKLIIISSWHKAYIRDRVEWTASLGSLPWYSQGKWEHVIYLISLFLTQISAIVYTVWHMHQTSWMTHYFQNIALPPLSLRSHLSSEPLPKVCPCLLKSYLFVKCQLLSFLSFWSSLWATSFKKTSWDGFSFASKFLVHFAFSAHRQLLHIIGSNSRLVSPTNQGPDLTEPRSNGAKDRCSLYVSRIDAIINHVFDFLVTSSLVLIFALMTFLIQRSTCLYHRTYNIMLKLSYYLWATRL